MQRRRGTPGVPLHSCALLQGQGLLASPPVWHRLQAAFLDGAEGPSWRSLVAEDETFGGQVGPEADEAEDELMSGVFGLLVIMAYSIGDNRRGYLVDMCLELASQARRVGADAARVCCVAPRICPLHRNKLHD